MATDYRDRLTYYRKLIIEVTGCPTTEARFVEDLMRDANGGTLDHLTRAKFAREARSALKHVGEVKIAVPSWDPL